MTMVLVGAVLVVAIAMIVGFRHRLAAWAYRPTIELRVIRNIHVLLLAAALVIPSMLAMYVSYLAREKALMARDNAIAATASSVITRGQVRAISKRTAVDIFNDCTTEEGTAKGCRRELARAVDRVFRVTPEGRIVAVEGERPPAARVTVEPRGERVVVRERVIERGPRGATGARGPRGFPGRDGSRGEPGRAGVNGMVDSKALDTIDARVRDLEQITGGLTRRLQRALSLLCPLVRALCG